MECTIKSKHEIYVLLTNSEEVDYFAEKTYHKRIWVTFCRVTLEPKSFVATECDKILPQHQSLLNNPFEFDYFELNTTPPFMILKAHYLSSLQLLNNLKPGSDVHVHFIEAVRFLTSMYDSCQSF